MYIFDEATCDRRPQRLSLQERDSTRPFPNYFGHFLGCIECIRCRLLLPIFEVSVSQSVCHTAQLGFTVQKWLNGSRCCLGWTLLGVRKHCVRQESWSPHSEDGELGKIFKKLWTHYISHSYFAVHDPMVWNSLPDDLRTRQDYESFRQGLKTWLFSRY